MGWAMDQPGPESAGGACGTLCSLSADAAAFRCMRAGRGGGLREDNFTRHQFGYGCRCGKSGFVADGNFAVLPCIEVVVVHLGAAQAAAECGGSYHLGCLAIQVVLALCKASSLNSRAHNDMLQAVLAGVQPASEKPLRIAEEEPKAWLRPVAQAVARLE